MPTLTKWKRYIARYKDGNLLFCKDIKTNEFSYCYALFDCQFQAMCISIPERARYEKEQSQPHFGADPASSTKKQYNVIMMKHEFDLDYLLLSLEEDATTTDYLQYFKDRFSILVAKSFELSPAMMPVTLSNRSAFGKLKLKILSLENLACSNTLFIRVTSEPFVVTSRKIIGIDSDRLQSVKR